MAFAMICFLIRAQEKLAPMQSRVLSESNLNTSKQSQLAKPAAGSLFLPFRDDFSYSHISSYPSMKLWEDSLVYINYGFAIAPMSIGVATFDGLNKHGYPHEPLLTNTNVPRPADTLTSRPINLAMTASAQPITAASNVGLSFYYQAGGYGDYPEQNDSLILDFYKPDTQKWSTVWYTLGFNSPNLQDTLFKGVLLKVDTAYLKDGFRLRFRNAANTTGDWDHWNLDYIKLDVNRDTILDTSYVDYTFGTMPGPLLKKYSMMPYEQFNPSEMVSRTNLRVKNNSASQLNVQYNLIMHYDSKSTATSGYNDHDNILYFPKNGYSNYQNICRPQISTTFSNVDRYYDFPITHSLSLFGSASQQEFDGNDTITQFQRFRNYYAFDDGSAEAGYYILGSGGKMAVKVDLNQTDSLLGIDFYFEHVGKISAGQAFKYTVWGVGSNGMPGQVLYQQTDTVRYIKTGYKGLPRYAFSTPKVLTQGTYFFGFQQLDAAGISVGYDRNFDFGSSVYFDSGLGWQQSQFHGSLMIHPVFKNWDGTPVGIEEYNTGPGALISTVFPNPASNEVNIQLPDAGGSVHYSFRNMLGDEVMQGTIANGIISLNTSMLYEGVYMLNLSNGVQSGVQKIIITR